MDRAILLASLAPAGYAAWYALLCAEAPFGPCRLCRGRLCRRCDGTGRRVRIGRRLYEYLRAEHARGTAAEPTRRPGR
jgi:hypothetical protein